MEKIYELKKTDYQVLEEIRKEMQQKKQKWLNDPEYIKLMKEAEQLKSKS